MQTSEVVNRLARNSAHGAQTAGLASGAHQFLPVYKLKRSGPAAVGDAKGISVICPGGLNGQGLDAMWQSYAGGLPVPFPLLRGSRTVMLGRHAAAELSAGFIASFMVNPLVEIDGKRSTSPARRRPPKARSSARACFT